MIDLNGYVRHPGLFVWFNDAMYVRYAGNVAQQGHDAVARALAWMATADPEGMVVYPNTYPQIIEDVLTRYASMCPETYMPPVMVGDEPVTATEMIEAMLGALATNGPHAAFAAAYRAHYLRPAANWAMTRFGCATVLDLRWRGATPNLANGYPGYREALVPIYTWCNRALPT